MVHSSHFGTGSVRILVVEDNPVDALCLKEALGESKIGNFVISQVETLAEARERLKEEIFDAIILDLGLPDCKGIETFLAVKDCNSDIPIVVLSGLDDETLAVDAVRKGAQDYLRKDKYDEYSLSRSISFAIERKMSERALVESEERFRAIFEGSEDYIWLEDKNLKITRVNPALANVLGPSYGELIGRGSERILGSEAASHNSEVDRRVLNGESVQETRTVSIGGTKAIWNIIRIPLRNSSGEITGLCGMARDVTVWQQQKTKEYKRKLPYRSRAMQSALESARMAGRTDSIILLLGESGSGKDYLAKYIHDHSNRVNGPYLSVNCATIVPELAESELFGHEKGAFTGATARKRGLLELAGGGTLLLNEIGELLPSLQAKLLTFLDTRKFTRVGGEKQISVNARLLAATHRDLQREVESGRFRRDLFYRINVMSIEVPPLRERVEDIPILVDEILSRLHEEYQVDIRGGIGPEAMNELKEYPWPGNVRELRNVLERALILADGKPIDTNLIHLRRNVDCGDGDGAWSLTVSMPDGCTLQDLTDKITKSACREVLRRSGGNKKAAARMLGISRDSLYRHLRKYGMNTDD
ncbi:MAG: sigma 54-interacting transcriptional regulator [Desulfomonilaceae bacterium]|nr:sigma 54-interacting transcriptional regulator [Desulfomonilaceae bacterium]